MEPQRNLKRPRLPSERSSTSHAFPLNDLPDKSGQGNPDAYDRALRFLYDRIDYERMSTSNAVRYRFRLQRMIDLLTGLGLQQFLYRPDAAPEKLLVHVAGTKGKGSVATMVAAMLSASGLKTGLYTSPHLHRLEERFRVDGKPCSHAELIGLVDQLRAMTGEDKGETGRPSFFEMTTAMALLHFERTSCEAIVLEVGLGGRLDSTNVCSPSLSVITSIGLDHQHVLGDTLVQIAREKAGIIKQHVPVISGVADADAADVIRSQAGQHQCEMFQLGIDFDFDHQPAERWGSKVLYRGLRSPLTQRLQVDLPLEGAHQARNATLAIAVTDLLRERGTGITRDAVHSGLASLSCEGRIERFDLPGDVLGIVDSAHNEDSINALCDCLQTRSSNRKVCVVFGTSLDKSAEPMLNSLAKVADRILLTRFHGNPRFRDPHELEPLLPAAMREREIVIEDPIEACQRGQQLASPGGTLVICGSFFLAAETRSWMRQQAETI